MKMLEVDIIIVGGSVAGTSLAFNLSRKSKLKILIIDRSKRELIGKKCCGDIFFGEWEKDHLLTPHKEEIFDTWKDHDLIIQAGDTHGKTRFTNGLIVDRLKYTQRLLKEAENNGVKLYANRKVLKPIIENDFIVGVVAINQKTKEQETYRAKLIVDTSGFAHVVRRNIPEGSFPLLEKKISYMVDGYREILKVDPKFDQRLIMVVSDNLPVGSFFWIVDQARGRVNAGMYIRNNEGEEKKKLPEVFKKILHTQFYTEDQYEVEEASGCPIPSVIPMTNIVGNGFVTFGEAGTQTSPIIGDGIRQSLFTGESISDIIIRAFEKGNFSEKGLWEVNKIVQPNTIKNIIAYFRLMAFKEFGNEGLRLLLKRIPDQIGTFFLTKDLSFFEQLSSAFKLREKNILKALLRIQLNTRKLKKIFKEYPDTPENYPTWQEKFLDFIDNCIGSKQLLLVAQQ